MSLKIIRIQSRICLGGPALHTILLTANLNREKFRTILVGGALEPGEGDISFWAESNNVTFTQIEQMGRDIFFLKDMFALIKLYRLIKREKPQIVHTHTAKAGALEGYLYERETVEPLDNWVNNIVSMYSSLPDSIKEDIKSEFTVVLNRTLKHGQNVLEKEITAKLDNLISSL